MRNISFRSTKDGRKKSSPGKKNENSNDCWFDRSCCTTDPLVLCGKNQKILFKLLFPPACNQTKTVNDSTFRNDNNNNHLFLNDTTKVEGKKCNWVCCSTSQVAVDTLNSSMEKTQIYNTLTPLLEEDEENEGTFFNGTVVQKQKQQQKERERKKTYKYMNSLFDYEEDEDEEDYDSDDAIMGIDTVPTKSEDEFSVLGTTYDTNNDYHHESSLVLSPFMMDSLRPHLPPCIQESNFWLKYSMIRDGAHIRTLLQKVQSSKRTLLVIETVEGDIIGSFTSAPWSKTNGSRGYYGSCEAFVWRTDNKEYASSSCVTTSTSSAATIATQKSIVEVFHWSGKNCNIQALVNEYRQLIIGGGVTDYDNYSAILSSVNGSIYSNRTGDEDDQDSNNDDDEDDGCSIIIDSDMVKGSSSGCTTFSSPPLIVSKPTSSTMSTATSTTMTTTTTTTINEFQIINLEVYSFTPFDTVDEAEKLENRLKFQVDHRM